MKKFTLMVFVMFVMLFGVMVGRLYGQNAPQSAYFKVYEENIWIEEDIKAGITYFSFDIECNNVYGKESITLDYFTNYFVFKDEDGHIYNPEILDIHKVKPSFPLYVKIEVGDKVRGYITIAVPIGIKISDLKFRIENRITGKVSGWFQFFKK